MTDTDNQKNPDTGTTNREADHPRQTYQTPANVVTDDNLSRQQKLDILHYWKEDVEARLRAESEGMGQSEPMSARQESTLAEEQQLVSQAIADVEN